MTLKTFSTMLLLLLMLFVLHSPPAAAASTGTQSSGPSGLEERLSELDGDLRRALRLVGDNAAEGRVTPHLAEQVEVFRHRLLALESAIHGTGATYLEGKGDAMRHLLGNLERAAAAGGHPAARPSFWKRDPGPRILRPGLKAGRALTNDHCGHALPIKFGTVRGSSNDATNDGGASCGASYDSPDLWFRVVAPADGYLSVDTFGSSYDTVVSVHTGCPGTSDNQRACNDDAYGLASAASFSVSAGEEYRIRLSGFNGATGPFRLHVGQGGEITGRLTGEGDGLGIDAAGVKVYNSEGYFEQSVSTDPDGGYASGSLEPGTYFVSTQTASHFDELYDDLPCEGSCDATSGAPVQVNSVGKKRNVDFVLRRGGSFSGTVNQNVTGDPVAGLRVKAYDSSGSLVASAFTDEVGRYVVEGLATGDHYAVASDHRYEDELYDDVSCASGCDPTSGAAVPVVLGAETPGVDFGLDRRGTIRGTVTAEVTGEPVGNVRVYVYDSVGQERGRAYTDDTGSYEIAGLGEGTYHAEVYGYGIVDELFQDVDCPDGCDVTAGAPIVVATNLFSTADFVVDVFGRISGTVTDATTGEPLGGIRVRLWNSLGNQAYGSYSADDGRYEFPGLSPDGYYVTTEHSWGYLDELYEGLPCPNGDCDPTAGTAVAVELNVHAEGVDFALGRRGEIVGTVTDVVTVEPVEDVRVDLYDALGDYLDWEYTDSAGQYSFTNLAVGTYFVVTHPYNRYVPQVYDGVACGDNGCAATDGTPIAVADNVTATADMRLERSPAITGRVTWARTGAPLNGYRVVLYDEDGSYAGSGYTDPSGADPSGEYSIDGLAEGTYFAATDGDIFQDELYEGVLCEDGCDPTTGTPLVAVRNAVTTADFALERLGKICGTVTDNDGQGIQVRLNLWNVDDSTFKHEYSGAGRYCFSGLPAGQYFVGTESDLYVDEVYDGVSCGETCEPTAGTPIGTGLNTMVDGIDFVLDDLGEISGTVTDAETGEPLSVGVEAWDAGGHHAGSARSNQDGVYILRSLEPGSYFVATSSGYADELYDDLPCPYGDCDPTVGRPVATDVNFRAPGVDFELRRRATIVGQVTENATGEGVGGLGIEAYDESGLRVTYTYTDSEGRYEVTVESGSYFLATASSDYLNEVYDDLACPDSCDPTLGSPVVVAVATTTSGVDFDLDRFAAITGIVTDESGTPLSYAYVEARDGEGREVGWSSTNEEGRYRLLGLDAGSYFVTAWKYGYVGELHDSLPCPGGPNGGCDPTKGTPVQVGGLNDTVTVDFRLRSEVTSPRIQGTIWSSEYRAVAGVAVDLWNVSGELVGTALTDSEGHYSLRAEPGTYRVSTHNDLGYVDEVYLDVVCPDGSAFEEACDPMAGFPLVVGQAVQDVDFVLSLQVDDGLGNP